MQDLYRPCAGMVVFNREKKVLVCARIDCEDVQWQFPQGGINADEDPKDAALRELEEETSLCSVKVVKTLQNSFSYEFPLPVRIYLSKHKIKVLGQKVYWSLAYFKGTDEEINLQTKEPEFKAWKWVSLEEAVDVIVPFKKEVYQKMAKEFAPIIKKYKV